MKASLTNLYTSIDGKAGFDQSVEVTINQTVKVDSREGADKLLAEYPNAAQWSERAEQGGSSCTHPSERTETE